MSHHHDDGSNLIDPQDVIELQNIQQTFDRVADFVDTDCLGVASRNFKFMNMYAVVFNAATRPKLSAPNDYYKVQAHLYVFCENILAGYMERSKIDLKQQPEAIYAAVTKRWSRFKVMMRWIEKTFSYLSRYYVPHCDMKPLDQLALFFFHNELFRHVIPTMRTVILMLLQREKNGEAVDPREIQLGTEIFVRMSQCGFPSVYRDELATHVVEATAEGYRRDAIAWLASNSATDFMERAEIALEEEQRRCARYFLRSTETELLTKVEYELLTVHRDELLHKENSGFVSLLRDMRTDHLRRAFLLFSRIPQGLEPLGNLLREQCYLEASDIVKRHSGSEPTEVNYQEFVADFLELHEKYKNLVYSQFGSDPIFQKAMRMAMESGLSQTVAGVHTSELLAAYCDSVIRNRGNNSKFADAEAEEHFDKIVSLLGHLTDKDIFQSHARQNLSARLLQSTANEETEKLLILKLKSKCGASFTSHFEGMMKDKAAASDVQNDFNTWLTEKKIPRLFEFNVFVLTYGFWPKFAVDSVVVPAPVRSVMDVFRTFYLANKTQHRVLTWANSHGNVALIGHFRGGRVHEFHMTIFQACVLLLFNDCDATTAGKIVEKLSLPFDELKKILPSFVRMKLVSRTGESKLLDVADLFAFNDDFTSSNRKIKIPLAQPKIATPQAVAAQSRAEEDRKPAIDACLVRIMKSRKQLEHSVLVSECMQQLSRAFHPDPRMIKLRIEDLINREFLDRVPGTQPSSYRYVA